MKSINNLRGLALMVLLLLPTVMPAQVQIGSGLKLTATGHIKLVFQDAGLINHGEFIPGTSTVIFGGDSLSSFIAGSQVVSFYDLTIKKDGKELFLKNNAGVAGTLVMDRGNVQLNTYQLDLGRTGNISGERNVSRIIGNTGGTIRAIALMKAPQAVNPGNIGVEISSKENLGETIILREHGPGLTANGHPHIQRYYDIKPRNNFNLRAAVKLFYLDAELKSNESGLTIYSRPTEQGNWIETGKDKTDMENNWIAKNELDQLHRFTLSVSNNNMRAQKPGKITVQIFPNPAKDQFTVILDGSEIINLTVNLYDHMGRLLESKLIQGKNQAGIISWNIERYPAGTYYLFFNNPDRHVVSIVKQ